MALSATRGATMAAYQRPAGLAQKGELADVHARMVEEAERELLIQAIAQAGNNQARAARWLGLSRFTLRDKLKQLGCHPGSGEV